MANIFDEFDKMVDTKALAEEVKNSADAPVYKDVPDGEYEVKIDKMEIKPTKDNTKLMLSVWFKIIGQSEFKGQMIFMNRVIMEAFGLHQANDFLRSLDSGIEIEFVNYKQYANLVMDVMEAIDGKFEYALKYGHNNKGYGTFEIEEVYELE